MAALVDDLVHEATVQLVEQSQCLPRGPERLRAHMAGLASLLREPAFGGFFDVLPHALRDPKLRVPIARLYEWYRDVNVQCVGGDEVGRGPGRAAAPWRVSWWRWSTVWSSRCRSTPTSTPLRRSPSSRG